MLNLDPAKLLVIAVVAVVLLGPDKLPQVARQIGSAWRALGVAQPSLEHGRRSELDGVDGPDRFDIRRIPDRLDLPRCPDICQRRDIRDIR